MKFQISGIAKYLPGAPITAATLEAQTGLPAGWVLRNSGVRTRHRACACESLAELGGHALRAAMTAAGVGWADLDQLLFTSGTFDHPVPYNACLLKRAMGAETSPVPCFDIDATCLSFLVGLDTATALLARPDRRRLAIACAEISSPALDPQDAKTYSLFGDAAAACVLERHPTEGFAVLGSHFVNHCEGAELALIEAGGNRRYGTDKTIPDAAFRFRMNGRALVALTFRKLPAFLEQLAHKTGVPTDGYDHYVLHQASKLGNALFIQRYNIDEDRVIGGLERYGNCLSASLPLGLEQLLNERGVQRGERVLLLGTAAGLSLGALALEF